MKTNQSESVFFILFLFVKFIKFRPKIRKIMKRKIHTGNWHHHYNYFSSAGMV
ncbi:hypothetical protein MROS_2796 [Melioribacter roseus P3M-2]|uniref:Uncharacterized protein n=1 Tax=Melioribacter roseus (strain DSM 23840 / JCM 17771 / VKM B-2668 / P3M-2) TaxID=1191523 RepID=I7A830_MELRP|nr:hypothetical protein MROS_2796 [Melioribacter roseus P3M-2]